MDTQRITDRGRHYERIHAHHSRPGHLNCPPGPGVNGTRIVQTVYSAALKPTTLTKQLTFSNPSMLGLGRSPQVGQPISVIPPQWKQSGVKTTLQWLRNGTPIPGATKSIYTPVAADQGKHLTIAITGSLAGYAEKPIHEGAWLHQVLPALPKESAPTISGTAAVGSVLTAKKGTYRVPTDVWFQWQRNGVDITGTHSTTYELTTADKGAKITVRSIEGSYSGFMPYTPTITSTPVTVL